jgi:HAD superfamily hydrolase (TIGR01509 family)
LIVKLHAGHALVFDCDGTLVDSEEVHADALWRALRQAGIQIEPELLRGQFVGVDNPTILEWVSATVNVELPVDFDALVEEQMDRAVDLLRPIDGAKEVVLALHEARVPLAVASNSSERTVQAMLRGVELMTYFEGKIASRDKVQFPKPEPDIYRLAARMLGITPEKCIAIEDSVPGVRSARAAGLSVIGFSEAVGAAELLAAGARLVVPRLSDLLDLEWEPCS